MNSAQYSTYILCFSAIKLFPINTYWPDNMQIIIIIAAAVVVYLYLLLRSGAAPAATYAHLDAAL
jgi:hypothetical protein